MHTILHRGLAAATLALTFVGAGCLDTAKNVAVETTDVAVNQVKLSAEALNKAKETAALAEAKNNETSELMSDDVTVAWVLTEGSTTSVDAKISTVTFGCNDRIAYVKEHRMAQTDTVVSDALVTLFSLRDQSHPGLYNALASSNMKVDKVLSPDGVTTEVWISGEPSLGGACDAPRFKEQIEATVRRFKPNYRILLNGNEANYRCLGDMSGECK